MNTLYVGISKILTTCILGLDEERQREQTICIDFRLELPCKLKKDTIDDTVNYADVAHLIKKTAKTGKFVLLETIAYTLCEKILKEFPKVTGVYVKVLKFVPLPDCEASFSECELKRE